MKESLALPDRGGAQLFTRCGFARKSMDGLAERTRKPWVLVLYSVMIKQRVTLILQGSRTGGHRQVENRHGRAANARHTAYHGVDLGISSAWGIAAPRGP